MPRVLSHLNVTIEYTLQCSYKRCEAVSRAVLSKYKNEISDARDATCGWDYPHAVLAVTFNSWDCAVQFKDEIANYIKTVKPPKKEVENIKPRF